MSEFNFDFQPESFLVGLGAGWASAYALYRARNLITGAGRSVGARAQEAQAFATRSADTRYVNDLLKFIERDHLSGGRVALSSLLVEPRFIKLPDLAAPEDEDEGLHSVFDVIPFVPDHPYLAAPYNVKTLSINDLARGDRAIAILGLPGSGRTTALYAIALWSLSRLSFEPSVDPVSTRLQTLAESGEVTSAEDERALVYTGNQAEQMARQALERQKGVEIEAGIESSDNLLRGYTPMLAHFNNIPLSASDLTGSLDPAEPLVRALQQDVSRITRQTMPRNFYNRLREGRALILIDGFDELPAEHQPAALAWLKAFIQEYDDNYIIVTGTVQGYAGLMQAGATPVMLRPFLDLHAAELLDRWAESWGDISNARRRRATVDAGTIARTKTRARVLTPFELALYAWAVYNSPEQTTASDWFTNYLGQVLGSDVTQQLWPEIVRAAAYQMDHGYITTVGLSGGSASADGTSEAGAALDSALDDLSADLDSLQTDVPDLTDDLDDLLDSLDDDVMLDQSESISLTAVNQGETERSARADRQVTQMLATLEKAGLLRRYRQGIYRFRYAPLAAYFASHALADLSESALLARVDHPQWKQAFVYAPLHMDVSRLVQSRLNTPPDVMHNVLLEVASWLRFAPEGVPWASDVLRKLGNVFATRSAYPVIRERAAAALVGTRQRVAARVFERVISHRDPDVRRLSCLALGAMRTREAVDELVAGLRDPDPDVSLSAGLALGAIGTTDALEEMARALSSGSEAIRQAVAESFAAIPQEGYEVLFEAIQSQDELMRRAAVFGLRRINTTWALIAIYRTSIEDVEWYVRSAAEQAFVEMGTGDVATGPRRYPKPDSIPWLRDWAQGLGETALRVVQGGDNLLQQALEQGDAGVQAISVRNIGQLGLYGQVGLLYAALRHREAIVRDSAYRALVDVQSQVGKRLPAPVTR